MLILNRFIYLFNILCKEGRLSHRTQCLITTSVDIMFINLTTEYYVWKQLLAKSMSHSNLPRDIFFVKRMLSSFWLIWKVIAIRFSHRKQCLIATSSNIVPSAPLHLNQIFCFYLYLNIKKVILLLNTNNLCQLQTFFY